MIKLKWLIYTVSLVMSIVMVGLGFWQLDRHRQKESLMQQWLEGRDNPPIGLESSQAKNYDPYTQVKARGQWLVGEHFFLDMRKHKGQLGINLVVPLVLDDGGVLLVNHGWKEWPVASQSLPQLQLAQRQFEIQGIIRRPSQPGFTLDQGLGKRRMHYQYESLKHQLPNILNWVLYPDSEITAGWRVRKQTMPNFKVGMHLGYAIQWFSFALLVQIFAWLLLFRKKKANDD